MPLLFLYRSIERLEELLRNQEEINNMLKNHIIKLEEDLEKERLRNKKNKRVPKILGGDG